MTLPIVLTCPDCYGVHFNVRWDDVFQFWLVCCEGCGTICELSPAGTAQVRMHGIEQ